MSNREKIQDVAESMIRTGGYSSFSFREIAEKVGIKSSSVHYHFATKNDLAVSVARRYTDGFVAALEQQSDAVVDLNSLFSMYVALFRTALKEDYKMCLCGMLAAESSYLPNELKLEAQRFFQLNIEWLAEKLIQFDSNCTNDEMASEKSLLVLSTLEGAMLTSQVFNDCKKFDIAAKQILQYFAEKT